MSEIKITAKKVTMPMITKKELNTIDNNFNSIIDEFIKESIKDKDLYIAQYIIKKQKKENQQLKKQLQNINDEFLKYDWKNSNSRQLKNQIKSLYEAIKGDNNE